MELEHPGNGAARGLWPEDGSTLDEEGRLYQYPFAPAIGSRLGEASFPATLAGIQTGFFDRYCTECHRGPSAPKGLDLSEGYSYEHLVGTPRSSGPRCCWSLGETLARASSSKLEGGAGLAGRQMPRGRPPRPSREIDVIRRWIEGGAPRN